MCGEKIRAVSATTASVGSPPRVRGKVSPVRISHRHNRITPACAGKRTWPSPAAQPLWDHPRVCGEKPVSVPPMYQLPGSPCGEKGRPTAASACPSGITPACAGKSAGVDDRCRLRQDHPRVCGEKPTEPEMLRSALGSPPRVRGKECGKARRAGAEGITPACAGKSRRWPLRSAPAWDHPRVCGEKRISCFCASRMVGSPPRVRGKDDRSEEQKQFRGITPACAGKSLLIC